MHLGRGSRGSTAPAARRAEVFTSFTPRTERVARSSSPLVRPVTIAVSAEMAANDGSVEPVAGVRVRILGNDPAEGLPDPTAC
jgi:hypothetical protein